QISQDEKYLFFVGRGKVRVWQGELPKAIKDLGEAAEIKPERWEAYYISAHAYEKQNNPRKAIEHLSLVIELVQKLGQPLAALYRERAQLHVQCQDYRAADNDLRLANGAETDPKARALGHAERGRILLLQNKPTEANLAYMGALVEDQT